MDKRIQIDAADPAAYTAMFALENYLQQTQVSAAHKELIKIRASQLNGCAFCIDMHTKSALKHGETPQRMLLLSAWKETDLFTEQEKAILKLTEEVTLIHQGGVSPGTYQKIIDLFGELYFSQLIMTIVTINSWNRISVSTNKPIVH